MAQYLVGNHVKLLRNGGEYFPALLSAITSAAHSVHLETYIFEPDRTGLEVADALMQAARRGVSVNVVVDGFGCRSFPEELQQAMLDAGVRLLFFRPELSRFSLHRHRLRRMHRKLALVDARVGFVGGINIVDDFNTPNHVPPRYDYAVQLEGPLLGMVYASVRHLWWQTCWTQFKYPWLTLPRVALAAGVPGSVEAALVVRDNLRNRRAIEQEYMAAIAAAQTEIIIACAYFLPGYAFRQQLVDAAARGVRVVILLQGRVEYWLLHHASRTLYRRFLEAGIEIFEYTASFMHAKVAVVDGHWATVGSSNIDPFSLLLAREANVMVRDSGFARELRADLAAAMQERSVPIPLADVRERSVAARLAAWLSYMLVRLLMGIAGYGKREYRSAADE